MKVVTTPVGVALIYEWDNHDELRAVLEYLQKRKQSIKPVKTEVHFPTSQGPRRLSLDTKDVEDAILARLNYLPTRRLK